MTEIDKYRPAVLPRTIRGLAVFFGKVEVLSPENVGRLAEILNGDDRRRKMQVFVSKDTGRGSGRLTFLGSGIVRSASYVVTGSMGKRTERVLAEAICDALDREVKQDRGLEAFELVREEIMPKVGEIRRAGEDGNGVVVLGNRGLGDLLTVFGE